MGRQRNRHQMKEQENPPKEELNEMEVSNLSDVEFKIMIVRMLNGVKKDIEPIKKGPIRNEEHNILTHWKE